VTGKVVAIAAGVVVTAGAVAWAFAQYIGPHAAELFYVAALACGFHVAR
jgi:hypothetical protein